MIRSVLSSKSDSLPTPVPSSGSQQRGRGGVITKYCADLTHSRSWLAFPPSPYPWPASAHPDGARRSGSGLCSCFPCWGGFCRWVGCSCSLSLYIYLFISYPPSSSSPSLPPSALPPLSLLSLLPSFCSSSSLPPPSPLSPLPPFLPPLDPHTCIFSVYVCCSPNICFASC